MFVFFYIDTVNCGELVLQQGKRCCAVVCPTTVILVYSEIVLIKGD